MAGKAAIYRLTTAANKTEASVRSSGGVIEFNATTGLVPDNRASIFQCNLDENRGDPEVGAPGLEISRGQDVGFRGLRYTLSLAFDESGGRAAAVARIRQWAAEPQTVKGIYSQGRIGFRYDYGPEFDVAPNKDAGLRITRFTVDHTPKFRTVRRAVLVLTFKGPAGRIGA